MTTQNYNPEVLSCLANLSSDEVFTPPGLVNNILDLLPKELWSNPKARFLDPFCKSGVFLREIAKRLNKGLERKIPNRQERINHIFKNQLYGIAITELTSLLARRSLYCSKTANGKYSVCDDFDTPQGNIRFERIEHTWINGKCSYCGASRGNYERGEALETHAYELIHSDNPEEIFKMKFDVIIGNPPYQLSDAGDSTGSSPIYQNFVEQAKKLSPRYLSMIIPSRWFAGGKGLDNFRDSMLKDKNISHLVDYPIAADVFPGVKVIGGICYFLWESDYSGLCLVTTRMNNSEDTMERPLDQFDTFVRFNKGISILGKVLSKKYPSMSEQVSRQKPFGLRTFVQPQKNGAITLYANKSVGKISKKEISSGTEIIDSWKVLISMGYGEGGEGRAYPRMIIGKPIVAAPPSACTETYIVVGTYKTNTEANHLAGYLRTRFLRFLVGLRKNTQHITRDRFAFVPLLPMKEEWDDKKLYKHFALSKEEIAFIESMVRPMENGDE
ncbi:MAG: Eco57I restriction-modification methylase domain-containing protein [Nitrospinota bacterium]